LALYASAFRISAAAVYVLCASAQLHQLSSSVCASALVIAQHRLLAKFVVAFLC
jgi:hypothetical protein